MTQSGRDPRERGLNPAFVRLASAVRDLIQEDPSISNAEIRRRLRARGFRFRDSILNAMANTFKGRPMSTRAADALNERTRRNVQAVAQAAQAASEARARRESGEPLARSESLVPFFREFQERDRELEALTALAVDLGIGVVVTGAVAAGAAPLAIRLQGEAVLAYSTVAGPDSTEVFYDFTVDASELAQSSREELIRRHVEEMARQAIQEDLTQEGGESFADAVSSTAVVNSIEV